MTTYTWEYGSAASGLQFTIEFDDADDTFTVTSLLGSFDLNALWVSDGNTTSDGYTLAKSDNSLNMNGTNVVWDDGGSTTQTVVWDDYGKLSSTGLGSLGVDKPSFIDSGTTHTFALSDFVGLSPFDPTIHDTLGVRATSVNGTGEIKWADAEPAIDEGPGGGISGRIVYSAPGVNDLDVFAFTFGAPAAGGPVILAPLLTGTFQNVNVGAGDQTNPHVSGDIATYTSTDLTSEIRYYDFLTNADELVPTTGIARLSDVSAEGLIAYSQMVVTGSEIGVFDTSDDSTFIIPGGTFRVRPSIGSDTVAFEDRSFHASPLETEIVVYDLATNTTTRLTNDLLRDTNPDVSPDGNVVVWQGGDTTGVNMDVYVSLQTAPGVWSTRAITGSPGEDVEPTTDGSWVVYSSDRDGDADIYFQPVGGGPEQHLDLPNVQRNPSISDGGIVFESNEVGGQFDLYLYDINSNALYQVTNTAVDESLNDFTAFPEDFII